MIDAITYNNKLNAIEKKFVDKDVYSFESLIRAALVFGVASAGNEIKRLEGKRKALSDDGIWQKVISSGIDDKDIEVADGILNKASGFFGQYCLKIQGNFEQDRLVAAEKIFDKLAESGYTQRELQQKLGQALGIWDKRKLENIARTETTKMFNFGRVEAFRENSKNNGIVKAVMFSAILDSRTSDICEARHGLILDINDPRIDQNTPPLHVKCRSLLIPVDKYDLEELHKGKSSIEWDKIKPVDLSWGNSFAYGGFNPKRRDRMEAYIESKLSKLESL